MPAPPVKTCVADESFGDALILLGPDSPPPRVDRLVRNAIDKAMKPWEDE